LLLLELTGREAGLTGVLLGEFKDREGEDSARGALQDELKMLECVQRSSYTVLVYSVVSSFTCFVIEFLVIGVAVFGNSVFK
jgi:hypothetical protein